MTRSIVFAFLTLAGSSAMAVDLPVVADVHVGANLSQTGTLPNLNVGGGARALLRFDLAVLPAGLSPSQVAKATLVFHVNRVVTAGPIRLSALAGPFQEATVVQASAPPAGALIGQVNPVQGINLVDITALVQQWVTSPGAAFGIELAADPSGSAALLIDSRENTATSFAAEVRVVLSGPAGPQGVAGLNGATGPTGPAGAAAPSGVPALAAVCALYFRNGIAAPAGMECPKLIFATQSSFFGNLGGLDGADNLCNSEAAQAGHTGVFKAWLSTATVSAASRMTQSNGPYARVDGVVVADNWADLTDGSLKSAIPVTQFGVSRVLEPYTWTNTTVAGASAGGPDCNGWTATNASGTPRVGTVTFGDQNWTLSQTTRPCAFPQRLYCVQQ
ncbi:MAG: DNRLRE domain-containing protein [Acidobacteria bacterium]|nr:DNRLRE domain-containing protein [Acidobacteriota bacterium]